MARTNKSRIQSLVKRLQASLNAGRSIGDVITVLHDLTVRLGAPIDKIFLYEDDIDRFMRNDYTPYYPRLDLLAGVLDVLEGKNIDDLVNNSDLDLHESQYWFDVDVRACNSKALDRQFLKLRGTYSCFYRSREREYEAPEYVERVRYKLESCEDKTITGRYLTRQGADEEGRYNDFRMVMSAKDDDVFSVFHFSSASQNTFVYSLIRALWISETKKVLFGITVREGIDPESVIAFKSVWLPEEDDDHLKGEFFLKKAAVEDDCWSFLDGFFDLSKNANHFSLEMQRRGLMTFYVQDYMKRCADAPLIRLRTTSDHA